MIILKYMLYVAIFITVCLLVKDVVKLIKTIRENKKNGRD
jgi:hypothetical protein